MINFITAGESHGKGIVVIVEGVPAGLKLSVGKIQQDLSRRRKGYGRGQRMSFENEEIEFISGLRYNETIGSPICVMVYNKDYRKEDFLGDVPTEPLLYPRPGHADLPGAIKFLRTDLKDISERSSARETVGRVVAGNICKQLLDQLGIFIGSFVTQIGNVSSDIVPTSLKSEKLIQLHKKAENSIVRVIDKVTERKVVKLIDTTIMKKDTLGGEFIVFSLNVPPGLGSYTQWNQRLDAKIAYYLMSIPAVKSIEIGLGKKFAEKYGSEVHDEIFYNNKFFRRTNNAGGIEGGISNGEPIIVCCVMKPIPTLGKPLRSVNIKTKKSGFAEVIRSDTVAVASCSVIAESMLAICLTNEIKLKFGGDSVKELLQNYRNYLALVKKF